MTNQSESTPPEDNITSILSVINNLPVSEFLEDKDVEIDISPEDGSLLPPQFKEIADKLHKQYLYWQILRNRQETTKPTFFGYIHEAIALGAKSVADSSDKTIDSQTVQLIETAITLATINALLIGAEEYLTEGNHQQDVKESIDTALSTLYEFIKVREIMSSSLRDALEEIRQEIEGMSEAQQLASYVVTQIQRLRENPQIKDSAKFYVVKNQLEKLGKTLELLIPADEIKPQAETTVDKSQIESIMAKLMFKIAKEELYMTTIHHHGGVESATFSPDSNYLATASKDNTVKVVEVATGKEITTIHHQGGVKSATFSPDGNYLATASEDKTAKVVEVATGKEITTIHQGGFNLVTSILDVDTGKEITMIHPQGGFNSVTFSPDSNYLATASEDKTAKVVEVATGKEITTIHHQYQVKSATFSPDSNYLATASRDNTAKVVEVATGKEITTIHQDGVNSATFSHDSNYLATASRDNTVKVIEVPTGKEITTIHHQSWVKSAIFSPDSNYLATASDDTTVKVVEVATGKIITTIHHQGWVNSATFSPDGNYLATASEDKTAKVVEVATGKEITTIHHQNWVTSATFSPDGNYLATLSTDVVKVTEVSVMKEIIAIQDQDLREIINFSGMSNIHHQDFESVTFSPDSKYFLTVSGDVAKLIKLATGNEISSIYNSDKVESAIFSPDGKYLATTSKDGTAKVINIATEKEIITIYYQSWVYSATFSPDSNYFATASMGGTVKLVNLAKLRQLLKNNQNDISASNPSQVNTLTYVDKPQAFFLGWLQNQANDYSFYEYILKQAQQEKQGFSVHNQIPLLDTDLCLQSLNFLLLNAEKHYQSVFHTLKGIEDKSIQVIALYDMKQSIMAGLATLHEFINNLIKFEGKDYQKAMEIFTEEIEKDVKITEIATDIYRRSHSLSQLEGIENFGELATIKDMLGEMQEIFKQVLPLSITSPPPKKPQIPLKVDQKHLRQELIEAINQAQPTEVKELIKHFISLGFKIDRKTAIAAIYKYNWLIFVSPWDDVTDYQVLLRLLGN